MSQQSEREASVGERVVVRLPETPTTGFQWQVVEGHDGLTVEDSRFEPPDSTAPGAGGHRVVTVTATMPGVHTLRLESRRSWEGSPADLCEIVIRAS